MPALDKSLFQRGIFDLRAGYPKACPQKMWATCYLSAATTVSRTLSKPATYCGFSERASRLA
ncbi:Uncharacterised protein [Bordetella pertussis]|nr:Uncharacterised protein [Bordetella pertussis]CFW43819.1 Uncharacterised protein [Bordetella pertussis]